jgi:hypothetical protein
MPSADDLFNQLVAANTKLDQIRTGLVDINATLTNGFNNLVTLGQYTNQALHHNDQQNDTIICALEHIAKNTCELLNQSVIQTALQTEMESDIDGLESMFASANPGAALERERLHRLEEKIEKCCPPAKPKPPCDYAPCPAPRPIGPPPRVGGSAPPPTG